MEVIDYIDITAIEPEHVTKAVLEYIESRKDIINTLDVQIRISICKEQSTARAGKNDRNGTLAQLIAIGGISTWEQDEYKFDFSAQSYRWKGKAMHITPGEAVALYQKLVRKNNSDDWPAFYANMKKRHSQDFLRGFV